MRELLKRIEEIRRNLEELKALLEALSVDCHAHGLPSFIANIIWKLKLRAEFLGAEILFTLSYLERFIRGEVKRAVERSGVCR